MVFRKSSDNENFDSTNILLFLHTWRKPLITVTVIAVIASVFFSSPWFITPKYRSTVVLYPAATSAISKALLTENPGSQNDILAFGEDEETEQMLQILHSNRIRDRIIQKYNLAGHYEIKPDARYKNTLLFDEYDNNISFRRTEFMAVKISVLDTDPQMAADIANDIADLLDSTRNEMQKKRAMQAYEIVKAQYYKLRDTIQLMEDSLTKLRELGVHDYETQSEMMNQQLAIELAKNNTEGIKRIEKKLETLARYGGPYVSIRDALVYEKKQLSMLRAKYEEAKTDAEEVLPTKFVVNSAYKAERKSYPIRWLIVLVVSVSSFLLTLMIILVFENVTRYFPWPANLSFGMSSHEKPGINTVENVDTRPPPEPKPKSEFQQSTLEKMVVKIPDKKSEKVPEEIDEPKNQTKKTKTENQENSEQKENTLNQMARYFTNTDILKLLFKWKIHLSAVVILSIILAAIFSSSVFITPKFKSFALVYPSNVQPYSEESESEQMLQFLQSKDIRDQLIIKYNLPKRYKIDSSYKYFQSALLYEISQNVIISKTPFESVKIEVYDADPQVACAMVFDIVKFYDQKLLETHREKYREIVDFLAVQLAQKKFEIDTVEAHLSILRKQYELFDYPNQSREIARGFLRTVDGNNSSNINSKEVLRWKNNLQEKGGEFVFYNDRYYDLVDEYGTRARDYEEAVKNLNKVITYANFVSKPFPADKKAYPVRWIIVLVTAAATLFTSFFVVLIIENFHSIKRNF